MTDQIFFESEEHPLDAVPRGLPLLIALSGLNDPGGIVTQLEDFCAEYCSPQTIVTFDADMLLDYRARRPIMTFDEDHFSDYQPAHLTLSLCHDHLGAPFLLLSGFEPDYRWEHFVETLLILLDELEVEQTVWAQGIPMPVPHTRPLRATVSGSRADLIYDRSVWKPRTKLPASVTHLIEYRLHSLGEEVAGFAILVPHYLAANEYPDALWYALDNLMVATGLIFETEDLTQRSREFREQLDSQLAEHDESGEMLRGLEDRYDSFVNNKEQQETLLNTDGSLPTADQLATELERFLAQQRSEGGDADGAGSAGN